MIKFWVKSLAALSLACSCALGASAQSGDAMHRLSAQYDRLGPFEEGRAVVTRKGKSGYVDTSGKVVVPLQYDHAMPFHNGFAVVGRGEGDAMAFALIDRAGRQITPFAWDGMRSVSEGFSVAYNRTGEGRCSYALVDTLGNVRPLEYDYCRDFSNGYAVVGRGGFVEEVIPGTGKKYEVFAGKCGYISPDGELAIAVGFDDARNFSDDGLAAVGMQGKYYIKWGFIDKSGRQVVPCNFYSVEPFSRDRALVSRVVAGGKLAYGYIDRSGAEVIACRFDSATSFRFPNAWVGVEKEGELVYVLIDSRGKPVMQYGLYNLQDGGKYGQAAGAVPTDDGLRYGIVDNEGAIILPFEYDEITLFSEWDAANDRWTQSAMARKGGRDYSFDLSKPGE